jgi:UDP-N-acetylglucosamine--N-acetylmuramyl-(pentapeptide) pyrophosphoryl-undecaprenol N-acetylglucosamine transferase
LERRTDIEPKSPIKILIAAGGTGGHVFPALAIADEIKKIRPDAEILFAGTKKKIESRVVPQRGYKFSTIWISGFHRSLRPGNLLFPLKIAVSLIQSFFLIKKFSPDAVVGTGGYVCGPVLYVASLMGLPVVVHESNSYPGVTTRMLSTRAAKIFIAFDAARRKLKRQDNIELVGTPTRGELGTVSRTAGIERFQLETGKTTVLVVGGSLGASSLNRAVKSCAEEIAARGVQFIWQTGRTDAALAETMKGKGIGWIGPFIDAVEYAYAAADIVVCRAGATTLAEITRLGKTALLVPYPFAAADHQTFNANTLAESGAAVMVKDSELPEKFLPALNGLLKDEALRKKIGDACRSFGRPNAGAEIARGIVSLI